MKTIKLPPTALFPDVTYVDEVPYVVYFLNNQLFIDRFAGDVLQPVRTISIDNFAFPRITSDGLSYQVMFRGEGENKFRIYYSEVNSFADINLQPHGNYPCEVNKQYFAFQSAAKDKVQYGLLNEPNLWLNTIKDKDASGIAFLNGTIPAMTFEAKTSTMNKIVRDGDWTTGESIFGNGTVVGYKDAERIVSIGENHHDNRIATSPDGLRASVVFWSPTDGAHLITDISPEDVGYENNYNPKGDLVSLRTQLDYIINKLP